MKKGSRCTRSRERWHTEGDVKTCLTSTCPGKCCFPVTYHQHWGIWHSQCWWSDETFEQPTWTSHSQLGLHLTKGNQGQKFTSQKHRNQRHMYIDNWQNSIEVVLPIIGTLFYWCCVIDQQLRLCKRDYKHHWHTHQQTQTLAAISRILLLFNQQETEANIGGP